MQTAIGAGVSMRIDKLLRVAGGIVCVLFASRAQADSISLDAAAFGTGVCFDCDVLGPFNTPGAIAALSAVVTPGKSTTLKTGGISEFGGSVNTITSGVARSEDGVFSVGA